MRQQEEMGAVSFPTGILLQLLLEKDKAAPGARRGRRHSAIVFKLIRSESQRAGTRVIRGLLLPGPWFETGVIQCSRALFSPWAERSGKDFMSSLWLPMTARCFLWYFLPALVKHLRRSSLGLCALMPTTLPKPANFCLVIPKGAM